MKNSILFLSLFSLILFSCDDYMGSSEDAKYGSLMDDMYDGLSGEQYNTIEENPFVSTSEEAVSTFSIDADGASFANTRRYLTRHNNFPPKDAVRTEELLNYFTFDYPEGSDAVTLNSEVSTCPWDSEHYLMRIGMKGKSLNEVPPSNFVFLIDVSGSMSSDDKLDLLKKGLIQYLDEVQDTDIISIVTYAGTAGVLLEGAYGDQKGDIKDAIQKLGAGGSTAGAAGISTAYEIAQKYFIHNGNNRIILGTDGDFNVGTSSQEELIELIETKRDEGVYLTVLGLGTGNYQEGTMEQLANNGNGTFEYLDSSDELLKVFVFEKSKFFTVAKDVKVQVQFDAEKVDAYRLIGYENRALTREDFENEDKDAGELGASQTVTAVYEIIPKSDWSNNESLASLDLKYKDANSDALFDDSMNISYSGLQFSDASENMRFAASVIGFGLLLRDSQYKGDVIWKNVLNWGEDAMSYNPNGLKTGYINLVTKAKNMD